MGRIYNQEEHERLLTHRSELNEQLRTVATLLNDEYESDAWDGDGSAGKLARYMANQQRHGQLTREIQLATHEIDQWEAVRPMTAVEARRSGADVRRRWMLGGGQMLSEDERQVFLSAPTDAMIRDMPILAMGGGEVFNPAAVLGPQYAVGDAGRSDLPTESASGAADAMGLAAPEEWERSLVETLRYYGAVARNCHNFQTSNGNRLHQNQLDTSDQEGGFLSDQSQVAGTGVPPAAGTGLGNVTDVVFDAFWRHSGFIDLRLETFDDIHFDVAGRTMMEMARRLGRGWNHMFTDADGTNKPFGIVTQALVVNGGAGSADDGTGGISYDNLLDLEYGIDRAYREMNEGGDGGFRDMHGGMMGWMFHESIEKQLRKLVHPTSKLPIWVPNLDVGAAAQWIPGLIFGKYPYAINNHMANGKTNNDLAMLFGSCGHYAVRNVGGPLYFRFFDSKTVENMAVRYIAFSRRDGRSRGPIGAGSKCEAYAVLQVKS